MISYCPITGDVDFDHLIKVVSTGILHYKITLFFRLVISILRRDTLRLKNIPFLSNFQFIY